MVHPLHASRSPRLAPAALALATACSGSGSGDGLPVMIDLQAAAESPTVITLSWSASPDLVVTDYHVVRDGRDVSGTVGLDTHYIDRDGAPLARSCYVVFAELWPVGAVGKSNQACATTPGLEAGWRTEPVATIGARGGGPALAIDGADHLHLAYVAESGTDLAYASDASGAWASSLVAGDADLGSPTSIAVDAGGRAHVAYVSAGGVRIATNAAGAWGSAGVASAGTTPAVALDGSVTHVVYVDAPGSFVHHATDAGGAWADEAILPGASGGGLRLGPGSAVVDGAGALHIVAEAPGFSSDVVEYLTNAGGAWETYLVTASAQLDVSGRSIVLDADGTVRLAYWIDQPGFTVVEASGTGATWQEQAVATAHWYGGRPFLARGPDGALHVAFGDPNRCLALASDAGGGWQVAWIACGQASIGVAGLTVDSGGHLHVLYSEAGSGTLRLASR